MSLKFYKLLCTHCSFGDENSGAAQTLMLFLSLRYVHEKSIDVSSKLLGLWEVFVWLGMSWLSVQDITSNDL